MWREAEPVGAGEETAEPARAGVFSHVALCVCREQSHLWVGNCPGGTGRTLSEPPQERAYLLFPPATCEDASRHGSLGGEPGREQC